VFDPVTSSEVAGMGNLRKKEIEMEDNDAGVIETINCSVILTSGGFYARCNAPNCGWISETVASRFTARRAASEEEAIAEAAAWHTTKRFNPDDYEVEEIPAR
jgi:hypothetical protein